MNWISIYPEIVLLTMACAVTLIDLFVTDPARRPTYVLTQLSIAVVAAMHFSDFSEGLTRYAMDRMVVADPLGHLLGFFACLAVMAVLVYSRAYAAQREMLNGEFFSLALFSLLGILVMLSANNFIVIYLGLELMSLSLYALVALRRDHPPSTEAAMKFFVLGALASGFLLYGMSMLYGATGSLDIPEVFKAIASGQINKAVLAFGLVFVVAGLAFKLSTVPFHMWVPDVYQGAPTPVTAFMSAATKIAAFGAMLRIFYVAVPDLRADWRPVLWAIAILTMVVGTVTAVTQSDVKRMLAYSAVSHAGFILTGVIALNDSGLSSTLFYLFAYGFSSVGAFAVVGLVRDRTGEEDTELAHWAGLGRRYPIVGVVFSLFLLAFAGIPLTSGFVSKFAVFKAAGQGGAIPLVIIGVIASAIAAYFYVRVIVLMFFTDPPADAPDVVRPSWTSTATVTLTAAITLALGALPQPLLDLANNSAHFVR